MNIYSNKKGAIILVIPLTLALLGLIGTGVFAEMDHEKNLESKRDLQRKEDILDIQTSLADFYANNSAFPIQKDQSVSGFSVLEQALGRIPNDPLEANFYWYWSDGQFYSLRYLSEQTNAEVVVFSQ